MIELLHTMLLISLYGLGIVTISGVTVCVFLGFRKAINREIDGDSRPRRKTG